MKLRNKLTIICIFVFWASASAQRITSLDYYSFRNGAEIQAGDSLTLIPPTEKPSFSNVFSTPTDRSDKQFLGKNLKQNNFRIISLRRIWWAYHDDIVYAIIEHEGQKYYLDIESALKSNELSIPHKKNEVVSNTNRIYNAPNGIRYRKSNLVEIGKGSLPSGGFKFLMIPNGVAGGKAYEVSPRLNNQKLIIKKIFHKMEKEHFLLEDANGNKFIINVNDAIAACEIDPCVMLAEFD